MKKSRRRALHASYTVEAAGVMAVVLFTFMILINQGFRLHAQTVGTFCLHERVEQERHAIKNAEEKRIIRQAQGRHWRLEISAPVFRPENRMRLWSLGKEAS